VSQQEGWTMLHTKLHGTNLTDLWVGWIYRQLPPAG